MNKDLKEQFQTIKNLMNKYEGKLTPKISSGQKYDLWSFKEVEIQGKKKKEINFATVQIQDSFVGFYFMPIYINPDIANKLPTGLMKDLKGKSCFHIKDIDKQLEKQISKALEVGYDYYVDRGFI